MTYSRAVKGPILQMEGREMIYSLVRKVMIPFVEGQERYGVLLDNLFYIIYAVGIACGAAAVSFGLYFFATNLKEKMGTLVGVAGFAVLGLVSFYGLADSSVLRAYEASGITVTEG